MMAYGNIDHNQTWDIKIMVLHVNSVTNVHKVVT